VVIDILDTGGVPQPGGAGARLEVLLAAQGDLVLEQDAEPFGVLEIARLGVLSKFANVARHALQAELVQQFESGVVEHRALLQWKRCGPRMLACTITVLSAADALGRRSRLLARIEAMLL
jgi:hypothetical protein